MPIGSKTAPEPREAYMTIGEWLTGPARGHDMSEMGPTEQHARDYIAKLEAQLAEWHRQARLRDTRLEDVTELAREIAAQRDAREVTIRRLSDENAALRLLLGDLGMGPVAIYGTDFPECPDASMHQPVEGQCDCPPDSTQVCDVCQGVSSTDRLLTRWRNGKRYELTPEDAKRFDEEVKR